MKALSLWQPWASAIALGIKTIETRSWGTGYRGPLVIHAASRLMPGALAFAEAERRAGHLPPVARLPFGALVCVVDLVDVRPTIEVVGLISSIEHRYGDYSLGRWAWIMKNVRPLVPLRYPGKQRLFEVPASLIEEVTARR